MFEISTRVILDAQGGVKFIVSSKKDITDEKMSRAVRNLAEEDGKSSELRYRRLFESAKDGILILDADSGQIVDVNPYLLELLGLCREDLLGRELSELDQFKDIVASRLDVPELQRGTRATKIFR